MISYGEPDLAKFRQLERHRCLGDPLMNGVEGTRRRSRVALTPNVREHQRRFI